MQVKFYYNKQNNIINSTKKRGGVCVSLALARKYRPASFDDLIGQESVSQTLSLALDTGRLSHAYLFSGLRGSGKTSTARIFAKALLCEQGQSAHPCDQCAHCIMANENRHMDIIEMDAASNRGIDDIKELIEHTKYKPSSARYKIFIIDEVHMLTAQAHNALLKTLEEPPSFVKFILATTDPLKLPATILSRTQHYRFKKIPHKLVLTHLEHILNKEGIEYEQEALGIIARSGAGSLRDSLTLLDQAIVYSKNYVDVATVTGMLGIVEPSLLENLLDNILQQNQKEVLAFVKLASDYETEMIIDELVLFLKELLFSHSQKISPMVIERFFRILADSKPLLNLGADEEFVLSLALFKMMEALQAKEIDAMIKTLEKELKGVRTPDAIVSIGPIAKSHEVIVIDEDDIRVPPLVQKQSTAVTQPQPADKPSHDQDIQTGKSWQHRQLFDTLVKKIYDRDHDLGSCFERNITFVSLENNGLTWESTAQDNDKKLLFAHWTLIKTFIQELFGIETKIINIPKESAAAAQPAQKKTDLPSEEYLATADCIDTGSMIESIEMKGSCIMGEAGETEAAKEKEPSDILKEPMVQEAIRLFDPTQVKVRRKV